MAKRGVEHNHHHHHHDLDASSVVGGLLLARHNHHQQQQQQQQHQPQISPPLDDDNQRGRNQAHHLPSFGEHPWDNPPSLRHDPPPLPQHRQSSQARGESDDDRASLDEVEGDNEAHCSGDGRLAIAFLLNPSGAGAAAAITSTATPTSTSASAGHKRKADDYDQAGRTTPGSSFPVPQQVAASRGGGGGGGAAELEERDDDADDRQLRRRRLEQQRDEAPPAIEGDARYSLHHHQPHLQHQHQHQHQHTHYQRGVLPSLSSLIMTASPTPSATTTAATPADLYHTPHHRTSPQRSPPPSPMMPGRALPAAGGFSPFHSPAPSPVASSGTSFAMGLSLADPSFFFHSFNCLPSAMSTRMDSEPEAPPLPPPESSSSSSSDSSAGFYYTPYERSQSAPSSPKLYVGDDAGLPEGEEAEEDYCGAPPRQGNTTTALTPEQLQLRLQTQALQTQLLVRQMQRKQSVQQLKRLHAQQRRQRFEVHSASASASFASSPSRAGEGGRKRSRGSRGHDGGEFDDDDDDNDNDENGGSKDEDGAERGEKPSAFEQQHNKELIARKLEDQLKLLKEKIMGAGDSGGDGGDSSPSSSGTTQEKRKRATPQQLKLLEEVFAVDPFPAREAKQLLAQKLGMSIRSITIWFQNKRARLKKFAEKSGTL